MRNGPSLGFVGYSGAHVNFEGKAEAAWSFFLRKTKSELPVSGWSTDCGEREGEREGGSEGEGGAHSRIGCAADSRVLCGTS